MFDDTMSHAEIVARHKKLSRKSRLSRSEETELYVLGVALHNGGRIETTRDHAPPKKRGFWS